MEGTLVELYVYIHLVIPCPTDYMIIMARLQATDIATIRANFTLGTHRAQLVHLTYRT